MPKVIKSAGRDIILRVKGACEDERDNGGPLIPFKKVRARVALLTGVSERTITQITREGYYAAATSTRIVTPGKKRKRYKNIAKVDDFDKCAIRHIIHYIYIVKKEIPTINKLWSKLKKDINFKYGTTSLRNILRSMGFKSKRCHSKQSVLIERSDIAAWRAKYIQRLLENRQAKRPVIYLDETHIDVSSLLPNSSQSAEAPGSLDSEKRGPKWIIAHAGGKNGFIENGLLLFKSNTCVKSSEENMNSANFMRWIREKVVPNLPESCIVVMDNAPYHCTEVNKAPTMGSTKEEMKEWLTQNNIVFEDDWTKAQLYTLIKMYRGDPQYEVDQLLNDHGHEVLRLPPFHSDLSPIEKIWTILKKRITEINVNEVPSEKALIVGAFRTITTKEWINICLSVRKIEDKYYESDRLLDAEMDNFNFNYTSDSTDSSDEDSSEG